MENAIDALKIVLGVFIFAIGLTLLFNLSSQARETAEILISENDKTKYYNYYEEATEELIDKNGNRIVELKDIIPAIYKYSEENYAVTIVNSNGEIVARFDLDTETACNNWVSASDSTKWNFINEINVNVIDKVNTLASNVNGNEVDEIANGTRTSFTNALGLEEYTYSNMSSEGMTALFKKLYSQNTSATIRREYYCYWVGTLGWTAQRIDSDLSRN